MRFPWQSAEDDRVQDDDAQEGLLDDEEGSEGDGDDEAEIPPETQALIDKARSEERQRINEAASRYGMALTGDGLGVTDYARAQASFGFQQQQQQVPSPLPQPAPVDEAEPELDAYDADSVKAYMAWQVRQQTKGAQAELQATQQMLAEERMSRAMDRVEAAVQKHAPHLIEYLDHPEFAEAFPQALQSQDPRLWGDSRTLARLVGALSIDMDREKLPKKDAARDDQGRFATMGAQQRAQLGQVAPSRDAGGAPPLDDGDASVQIASRYLGVPQAQVRAARQHSIVEWRREREAAKNRGRR